MATSSVSGVEGRTTPDKNYLAVNQPDIIRSGDTFRTTDESQYQFVKGVRQRAIEKLQNETNPILKFF